MNIKIGNTPMIRIKYRYNEKEDYIYSKLEAYNLTGSIKDRVAYYIIKEAYKKGEIKEGQEIVEATSGNTGIALAALGNFFKNPVRIYMPDWVSVERQKIMKMYNAEVVLISKEEGGFKRAIQEAKKYAKEKNAFLSNQFGNKDNILAHYETTGKEIIEEIDKEIGGFVSGIGTGGTLMGIAKRLKEKNDNVKIYALEPDVMPILSQNRIIGPHEIEGIGDEFVPELVKEELIDKVILINDRDAINMAKKIASKLGIGVGISSGANMIASILAKEENSKVIVTVFPDDNKKYLSTKLSGVIEENTEFVSSKVELLEYEFI